MYPTHIPLQSEVLVEALDSEGSEGPWAHSIAGINVGSTVWSRNNPESDRKPKLESPASIYLTTESARSLARTAANLRLMRGRMAMEAAAQQQMQWNRTGSGKRQRQRQQQQRELTVRGATHDPGSSGLSIKSLN